MRHQPRSEIVNELRDGWGEECLALYFPRPVIELGSEKWRIFQKNILTGLEEENAADGAIATFVNNLDIRDFGGNGYALFQLDEGLRTARLSRRPIASLVRSDEPFVLPLLADLSDQHTEWVLVLERDQPKLYVFDGQKLSLQTDNFDAVTYQDVEDRRLIQDDIFFHAAARRTAGAARGPSIFHALGSDQSRERDKTDEAFYREVIDALIQALPGHVDRLTVFGDPHTVGPFEKLLAPTGLDITQHHAAGDALTEARLLETMGSGKGKQTAFPPELVSEYGEIERAAEAGQVESVFVSETLCCLEDDTAATSEHLRLRRRKDLSGEIAANAVLVQAIATGAVVELFREHESPGSENLYASLRWGTAKTQAG